MRDALSIAEQCLAYKSNNLTYSDVTEILGTLDDAFLFDMASYIANSDTANVLLNFNSCINNGKSPESFAEGMLKIMRDILLYNLAPGSFELSSMKRTLLEKTANLFSEQKAVRCIEVLSELLHDLKFTSSPGVLVECALVRLSNISFDDSTKNILERINSLEDKISNGKISFAPINEKPQQISPVKPENPPEEKPQVQKAPAEERKPSSNSDVSKLWNEVKATLQESGKLIAFVNLFGVEPEFSGNELVLKFTQRNAMSSVSEPDNLKAIETIASEVFAKPLKVRCIMTDGVKEEKSSGNDIFNDIMKLKNDFPENFKID